jgi:hypothetical protein
MIVILPIPTSQAIRIKSGFDEMFQFRLITTITFASLGKRN